MLRAAFFYLHGTQEKVLKRLLYEKGALKTLMKLTSNVNFINVLRASFLYKCRFGSFFNVHVTRKSWQNVTFV